MTVFKKLKEYCIESDCSQKNESQIERRITPLKIDRKMGFFFVKGGQIDEKIFPMIKKDKTESNSLKKIDNLCLWTNINQFRSPRRQR
jgi:hypothetical protein